MSKAPQATLALVVFFLVALSDQYYHCIGGASSPLQVGFYYGKCGAADVEAVVSGVVQQWHIKDPTITPALVRMQFHDCFVQGCDASILLDGANSEKTAGPNLSVRGFDLIDAIKTAVEGVCPGVVSCADIIALATRDAVALAGGTRYDAETGRRDGTVSLASLVNLPFPTMAVSAAINAFAEKNLGVGDMVLLLGGHTVGVAHCSVFQDRLYNFQGTGQPDPTMSLALLSSLRNTCPQNATIDNTANLDQNPSSSSTVDNSYYQQIMLNRGVLQIDQELALDPLTKNMVSGLANGLDFTTKFGQAMINLGAVQVLTGNQGQIRTSCRAVNAENGNKNQDHQNKNKDKHQHGNKHNH